MKSMMNLENNWMNWTKLENYRLANYKDTWSK